MSARQSTTRITAVVASACLLCLTGPAAPAQIGARKVVKPNIATDGLKLKPKPETETAKRAAEALDEELELGEVDVSIGELGGFLEQQLDAVGVFLDHPGLQVASVDTDQQIRMHISMMPLRAALRKMLRPLSLKAIVEEEGLVITADYAELARRGIATDRWTQGTRSAEDAMTKKMDQSINIDAVDEPLFEFIARLSQQVDLPMLIDRRALEEIGLSAEEPVSMRLAGVSLRSGLRLLLRELDLTYMFRNEVLQITTIEAAEMNLIRRVYFMEGLGRPEDAPTSMRNVIMACVVPDTWDQIGGPSTIIPLVADDRPAIVVSTTSDIHDQIKALIRSLRKASSTESPNVDVPSNNGLR